MNSKTYQTLHGGEGRWVTAGVDISRTADPVGIENGEGASPFLIVCEHASNFIPASLGTLGLPAGDLIRHIAWDPGALPVSRGLSRALDATLVFSRVSRLVIDCNRPVDAADLIPEVSETTVIPGNRNLSAAQRAERIALSHAPFHAALDRLIEDRLRRGQETAIVTVHSFTPVYKGVVRPWQVGIIHDEDDRLAAPMIARLQTAGGLTVGVNEPYSPADRVYYTLEQHARPRGLACAMIEIRNDEIADETGQARWVDRLAAILNVLGTLEPAGAA